MPKLFCRERVSELPIARRLPFLRWSSSVFLFCLGLLYLCVVKERPAFAQQSEVWAVLPFAVEGVDPNSASTFHSLLTSELTSRTRARFVGAPYPCLDTECARSASARLGASIVVYGTLRQLGARTIATATAVEGATGRILASQTMSADRVEDLELVARRLADSLAVRAPTAESAEPGPPAEDRGETRRGVSSNVSLRMGTIMPLNKTAYAGLGSGVALDLGMWLEARTFALEPRVGLRFDVYREERGAYLELPIDLGAYYILGSGDVAPILGGGVGLHYLSEKRRQNIQIGQTLIAEHTGIVKDSGWGFAAHGRLGLLLFRTHRVHVLFVGDYNATFLELNGGNIAQSFLFGLTLVL